MNVLFSSANVPFLVALLLMLVIGVLETLALLIGSSVFEHIDDFFSTHIDIESGDGLIAQGLGWLHVGRAPMLVLIVLFLGGFAVIGLIGQWLFASILGFQLPSILAVIGAFVLALPFVRTTGGLIARYVPRDETTAVSEDSFVGRLAVMTGAPATYGLPAEAKLTDEHGQTHYILVEPDEIETTLVRGETVLIVARISGTQFRAIHNPRPDLL